MQGGILLSPNKVSFRENLLPGGTLSPNGYGFREEMPSWCRERYFCPRKRYLSGRIYCRRALCPQMAAVSGRKCPRGAERDTFVPERGIFPGETYPRRALCPRMAAVIGRTRILPGTFLAPRGMGICIVGEIFFVEQMHLLKKIVTFGQILLKIYLNIF